MKRLTKDQASICSLLLKEAYSKNRDIISESRRTKTISLLYEAIDPQDMEKKIDASKEKMKKIIDAVPSGKMDGTKSHLSGLLEKMPAGSEIAGAFLSDDEDKMKEVTNTLSKASADVSKAIGAAIASAGKVSKALTLFDKKLDDKEKALTLSDLCEKVDDDEDGWKNKFVKSDALKGALQKAYKVPPAIEQAWKAGAEASGVGKIGAFLGKLFGADSPLVPVDTFVNDIMELTFKEFMDYANTLSSSQEGIVSAVQGTAAVVSQEAGEAVKDAGTEEKKGDEEKKDVATVSKKQASSLKQLRDKMGLSPKEFAASLKASGLIEGKLIGGMGFANIGIDEKESKNKTQVNRWLELAGINEQN